jgi:hypothetical protein
MVLGDSMVAAGNTPVEHTLVGELRAAGIASYNAGVDGAGTFNEVHLLHDHLRNWCGHIVVVAFYLGNLRVDCVFSLLACLLYRRSLLTWITTSTCEPDAGRLRTV